MHTRRSATAALRRVIVAAVAALAFAGAAGGPVSAAGQDETPPRWFLSLLTWLAAVNTHQPGTPDAAIGAVVASPLVELENTLADVLALRDRLSGTPDRPISYRGRQFTAGQLRQSMGIRDGEPVTAGMNRLLHRAAAYHADVAIAGSNEGTAAGAAGRPGRSMTVIDDGQQKRTLISTVHWQFGRELLDRLSPSPSRDPVARAWYVATGAVLQRERMVSEADEHLSRARQIFPDDPQLLFRGACAIETLTAPTIQAAMGPEARPVVVARPSVRSLLDRAEQLFRRALEKDSTLTEARVRLARLTAAHGRHREAIDMLQQAVAAAPPENLRFLALMLLGDELMAVGLRAEARARYEEAADLYPTAQSPLLALALLARERGDRPSAVDAVERLARLPPEPEHRVDPSWGYYVMQGSDASRLMQQLYALVLRETP